VFLSLLGSCGVWSTRLPFRFDQRTFAVLLLIGGLAMNAFEMYVRARRAGFSPDQSVRLLRVAASRGGVGLGDIATLASTIQQIEGYCPPNTTYGCAPCSGAACAYPNGTLAWQNQNPGNLVFVGQSGAVQGASGFAKWPSYAAGWQGLLNQINIDASNGLTLSQFISKYAPPSQNNTAAYLAQLESATGYGPDDLLSDVISGAPSLSAGGSAAGSVGSSGNASDSDLQPAYSTFDFSDISTAFDPDTLSLLAPIALGLGVLWFIS
jgi:hypothetical protein